MLPGNLNPLVIGIVMEVYTYDNLKIWQGAEEPAPGDKVENAQNTEIKLTDKSGKKRVFEVREGIIKRELKTANLAGWIIFVVFVIMCVATAYFSWLWWTVR